MIRIGQCPCSWGILEFEQEATRTIGYEQMLDEIQATGYEGTELGDWGFLPTDAATLKEALASRRLALNSAFLAVNLSVESAHDGGVAAALERARLLAAVGDADPFIVLADENCSDPLRTRMAGRIRPEHGLDGDGWRVFAGGVERIARAVREETGIRTVFHHHCAGFVETAAETERLLELTDPELVGLCFDTGHWRFAGGDPLDGLKRLLYRTWMVHFKDCEPAVAARSRAGAWDYFQSVRQGVFCELGRGEIDFPAVLRLLRAHAYDGWIVVEQDVLPGMGSPKASSQRNRDYLRSIGLD